MARYFKYILTFILLISSLGGYGQQMYDGSGSLLGRYDNGKLYNRSGAYEGQINSQRFYSRSGSYLGNESNGKYMTTPVPTLAIPIAGATTTRVEASSDTSGATLCAAAQAP